MKTRNKPMFSNLRTQVTNLSSSNKPLLLAVAPFPPTLKRLSLPVKAEKSKVVYNGKGKYAGEFKKLITIRSNASNELVRLYIMGNMEAAKPSN